MWYASPGNQGWGSKSLGRKPSVIEADVAPSTTNALKPSAGRVIRIINNMDHSVQVNTCNEGQCALFSCCDDVFKLFSILTKLHAMVSATLLIAILNGIAWANFVYTLNCLQLVCMFRKVMLWIMILHIRYTK